MEPKIENVGFSLVLPLLFEGSGWQKGFLIEIDFASRFPPRQFEASELRIRPRDPENRVQGVRFTPGGLGEGHLDRFP